MINIKENCYKGTRILLGNEQSDYLEKCRRYLISIGFNQISVPSIQFAETFKGKVGEENNNMMFSVKDRSHRDLCLVPEITAVIQKLATTYFKQDKDVKLFYIEKCFRGEKPQKGRYREFIQLGVEILNPTKDYSVSIVSIAGDLINYDPSDGWELKTNVKRGLDYYKEGKGFEISCNKLGSSKQICGGGIYDGGIGFAIGVDRLMLCK